MSRRLPLVPSSMLPPKRDTPLLAVARLFPRPCSPRIAETITT